MKLRLLILLFLILIPTFNTLSAQEMTAKERFAAFKERRKNKITAFNKQRLEKYELFKQSLIEKWGVADTSNETEIVIYNDKLSSKFSINYQHNTVELITIDSLTKKQAVSIFNDQLASPIDSVRINEKVNTVFSDSKTAIASKSAFKTSPVTIAESISLGTDIKLSEIESISVAQAQRALKKKVNIKLSSEIKKVGNFLNHSESTDKEQKSVMSVYKKSLEYEKEQIQKAQLPKNISAFKFSFKNNRVDKAKLYLNEVNKFSKKYNVDPFLILAIVETESSFNPLAKSYIPAFGLMQIVPSTAGLDVNRRVFKQKSKPAEESLYSPQTNILYGVAYLNIVQKNYFPAITDEQSKLLCTISAYNTGVGNVAKAFNGTSKSLRQAQSAINNLTVAEVKNTLLTKTPEETKNYLKKVLVRKQFYETELTSELEKFND